MNRLPLIFLLLLSSCTRVAWGDALAVLGEAEGESYRGKVAVACGILNRPEGLRWVYGANTDRWETASWSDRMDSALAWVLASEYPEICWELIKGADMWENVEAFGQPKDWGPVVFIIKIGDHSWYRRIISAKMMSDYNDSVFTETRSAKEKL